MKTKHYFAYRTGGSVVMAAPKNAMGVQYLRDKVGDTITYTPFSLLDCDVLKIAPIENMVTGMNSGGNVVLTIWKEYLNHVFKRIEDSTGNITYEPVEENDDT